MNSQNDNSSNSTTVDAGRRKLLEVVGAGAVASAIPTLFAAEPSRVHEQTARPLRWGIVGTGGIANYMVPMIKLAGRTELVEAESSLSMMDQRARGIAPSKQAL